MLKKQIKIMLKALQNCDSSIYEDMRNIGQFACPSITSRYSCPSYKDIYTKCLSIDRVYEK